MTYPTTIPTFTTKTDGVDYPQAEHINTLQTNLYQVMVALATNFGASPTAGDLLIWNGTEWEATTVNSLTADGSPDTAADYLLAYDASAGTSKKVLMNLVGGGGSQGRVEFLTSSFPTTVAATQTAFNGGSTPVEQYLYWAFANSANQYRDFYCRLVGYNGGGLTFKFLVNRTSAAAAENYKFEAAIRRINSGTEDITASHTYDYNSVTITVPAGPPAAGIPMLGTITFTDGADMDNLADGEFFIFRLRRDVSDTATDVARVLAGISGVET